MRRVLFFVLLTVFACGERTTTDTPSTDIATLDAGISAESLATHVRYLAADALGGRSPGTRGEELTLVYLQEQYANMGLRPGNPNGMYLQDVSLIGFELENRPRLELEHFAGNMSLEYGSEFVGWTLRRDPRVAVEDAELIFVGYGVVAPEYDWDDYKGVDVRGKILVMFVGDPPLPDTTRFGGKAMTYYGRWTYKYEVAAEKGAAGAILIHKTDAAGYPWAVVENSWSGEQFDVERPDRGASRCALEGWITQPVAQSVFARTKIPGGTALSLEEAYEAALGDGFRPVPLGITANCILRTRTREVKSYNVVAKIEGTDPVLKDQYVIYTAHWDHLGVGKTVDGDSIYNGALDNATGVAATLEIARAFTRHAALARRSVLFINTTAEESGLIGAKHYAAKPLYPLEDTAALINIDGLNVWGPTEDIMVVGYGFSDLDKYLSRAVAEQGRVLSPDQDSEKGYYYRSDHFPFAKRGVPALYADSGMEHRDRPHGWGQRVRREWVERYYHKPQDEFDPEWRWGGAVEDVEALFRVGLMVAASAEFPEWSDNSEFRKVREASRPSVR